MLLHGFQDLLSRTQALRPCHPSYVRNAVVRTASLKPVPAGRPDGVREMPLASLLQPAPRPPQPLVSTLQPASPNKTLLHAVAC